jgi:outer membrane protein TolC
MKKRFLIVLIGLAQLSFQLKSQDTLLIDKTDFIQRVLENNAKIKIAEQQNEMAKGDYNQSMALFMPDVKISNTAIITNNPLMAFGSKLNQERLTAADFDPNRLNDPSSIQNYALELQVIQPLLNFDGFEQRNAAKIQVEAMQLNEARTAEYLTLEANKAYMQLQLAYEAVDVLERAKITADEGLRLINNYELEGLVKKSDVLDVGVRQIEVANLLNYAKSNLRNTSDYLTNLMGNDFTGSVLKPNSSIASEIEIESFSNELTEGRKDLLAMDMSVEGSEHMLKSQMKASLPRINAFGNYQIYDNKPLGFGASGYLVGLQLSWNVFDGNRNVGKVQKAQASLEKTIIERDQYKQESQMELNKAKRQLFDAESKVDLAQKAFEQKKEAYRIRKDRFESGLEKTTDLLMAETQMFQKELEYLQAIFEHNYTKEYLRFLTR